MSSSEQSFQQLDPVGGYSTRPVTLLLSLLVVIYAAAQSAFGWDGMTMPYLALLALTVLVLAALGSVFWSSPLRAPFPRTGFIAVTVLTMSAMVLDAAASWNGVAIPPGEWGPVAVGLTLVQLMPYGSPREIGIATTFGAVIAGFIAILHPATTASGTPMIVTIVATTVPLMAFGYGSAAYASSLRRALGRVRTNSILAASAANDELRESIVRSVQQDRVSILNRTVIPFFTELLRRDRVTAIDRESAAVIADSIRSIMVAEADRSWLDNVIDHIAAASDGAVPGSEVVQDDERLAAEMSTEQRIVTRALIVALFEHPGFDPDGFGVLISRHGGTCAVTLTAKLDLDESIPRSELAAYIAVLRIVFGDLQLTFQPPALTLRFSYEHK
jgi:hypothetical protein